MKRISLPLFVAAAAIFAASCNKQDTTPLPSTDFVQVSFGYSLTTGAPMTKGSTGADLLATLTPTDPLPLTLTNTATGKEYSVTTGQTIALPLGTYSVVYEPTKPSDAFTFCAGVYLLNRPQLRVNTEITLSKDETKYTIPAEYAEAALLFSTREVSVVMMKSAAGTSYNPDYAIVGDIGALFIHGTDEREIPLVFTAKNGYNNASLSINTTDPTSPYFVQAGYWYALSLARASQNAAFSFGELSWQEGSPFIM